MWITNRARCGIAAAALAVSSGCGDSSSTAPSPNPGNSTITITSNGVSPTTLSVTPGSQVTFTNHDSRAHEMTSDPHPTHEDCPELNQVGFLAPGQSRESGNLVTPGVCGFHDHLNSTKGSLRGAITIR